MVRLAAPFALAILMITASVDTPRACDCVRLGPLDADVGREAPVIFSGKALEIVERNEHTTRTYAGGAETRVRTLDRHVVFEVIAGWRGVKGERVELGAELSDCVFPFEIGVTYLVFAHHDARGRPSTNICTRTTALSKADPVLRALGTPTYRARD
jgi:hypothetical protein